MCWCAQLMIQCETRLASVLWRFQIKSTLHNSLFTTEFFFFQNKNWEKIPSYVHTRQINFPEDHFCPSCSSTHLHFWYNFLSQSVSSEKRLTATKNWEDFWNTLQQVLPKLSRVHSNHAVFYLVSIYDSLKFNFLTSFGLFLVNFNRQKIWLGLHKGTVFVLSVLPFVCKSSQII